MRYPSIASLAQLYCDRYKYNLENLLSYNPETLQETIKGILEQNKVQISHAESGDPIFDTLQRIATEKNPSANELTALEAIQEQFPEGKASN